ncbi:membrane progestin receptor gamma-B-like [Stylophora pistillata]|uniref:membrane progestin receptor gamma-B-like n=1 Tax=Stylophora pistillata TaxID=50429 RepID=UPI000C04606E|nr:membrane progestin receptor gamma-B-like [Stylophora pistillata]
MKNRQSKVYGATETLVSKNNNQRESDRNIVPNKHEFGEETHILNDLVNFDKVPSLFHQPYIISSYRKCDSSAWYCFKSLFQATNETINIWSHLLAFAVFALRFASVFTKHKSLEDTFVYPLICFAFGICVMLAMSVGAHLFNCMSIKACHVCFFFDYAAISIYTFTAGQVFYFYSRPLNTNWMIFNIPALFLGISAAISFTSTWACCYSFCSRSRFDAALKAGTYISSWLFNTSPYLTMLSLCSTTLTCRHCLFYAGGTLAYVFRVPERLMIGVFDVVGHSHHFLHILCAIGAADEFSAVELDMLQRKAIIEPLPGPTFSNSILLTILVVLGNISVVLLCTRKLNLPKH